MVGNYSWAKFDLPFHLLGIRNLWLKFQLKFLTMEMLELMDKLVPTQQYHASTFRFIWSVFRWWCRGTVNKGEFPLGKMVNAGFAEGRKITNMCYNCSKVMSPLCGYSRTLYLQFLFGRTDTCPKAKYDTIIRLWWRHKYINRWTHIDKDFHIPTAATNVETETVSVVKIT